MKEALEQASNISIRDRLLARVPLRLVPGAIERWRTNGGVRHLDMASGTLTPAKGFRVVQVKRADQRSSLPYPITHVMAARVLQGYGRLVDVILAGAASNLDGDTVDNLNKLKTLATQYVPEVERPKDHRRVFVMINEMETLPVLYGFAIYELDGRFAELEALIAHPFTQLRNDRALASAIANCVALPNTYGLLATRHSNYHLKGIGAVLTTLSLRKLLNKDHLIGVSAIAMNSRSVTIGARLEK